MDTFFFLVASGLLGLLAASALVCKSTHIYSSLCISSTPPFLGYKKVELLCLDHMQSTPFVSEDRLAHHCTLIRLHDMTMTFMRRERRQLFIDWETTWCPITLACKIPSEALLPRG